MNIEKIFGFLAPALKEKDQDNSASIIGEEISTSTKLHQVISEIFNKSEKECDIPIKFLTTNGKQENPMRDQIMNLNSHFSIDNCIPIVRKLSHLTDGKTKDGLVFFVSAKSESGTRIMVTRFPAETGITISPAQGKPNFNVVEDVFLKNSRKYKAVYYNSSDQFWFGYATDKQVNEGRGKVKEISDYWIKHFLESEMKITSKRGTEILAKAVRSTLETTDDDDVQKDLVTLTTTIKNANKRLVSFESFFDEMNLSEGTKKEVLKKIDPDLLGIKFELDVDEFRTTCNYLVNVLDNGAIVIGPAKDFDDIWSKEFVAENDEYIYSTTGRPIKSKFQQRV